MPNVNSEPVSPIEPEAPQDLPPCGNKGTLKTTDNTDALSVSRASTNTPQEHSAETEVEQPTVTQDAADTPAPLGRAPDATDTNVHEKPPEYESFPEVHFAEQTHGYQLPQVVFDPNNYPQVSYGNHPEAYNADGGPEALRRRQPEKRTCGLRRKRFLLTLVVGLLIVVILAAVLGGVLGSWAGRSKGKISFMPTTALAAVNYTETSGVEHRRVYWQAEDNELYQSAWDSNSRSWEVSPLNPHGSPGPKVKPGTPLAAYIYNDRSHSTYEFHVFFLDTQNRIWERGTPNADDMWGSQVSQVISGNYTAANDSKLAVYADGCEQFCASTSVIVWQNTDGGLSCAAFITDYGWWAFEANIAGAHRLLPGSSLSLMPVWANSSDSGLIALYANTGNLTKFVFNTTKKWEDDGWSYNGSLAGEIASDAVITAFSQGYDGLNNTSSDVEIIATNTDNGKVYAVEGNELIEWEWSHLTRSFRKNGVLNTQIS